MPRLTLDISMSLDGFVAGPNASLEQPLGAGGDRLHEWAVPLAAWRKPHGLTGGAVNRDSEVVDEALESTGAYLMSRRMFGGGEGLGDGVRLFDLGAEQIQLECTRVIESPAVAHLKYRVVK
jgi:hypothetical protein